MSCPHHTAEPARWQIPKLAGGRLLVSTPQVSTVFREDGTKDPVQPVRSADTPDNGKTQP
jgi:hypothetical protein